MQLKDNWSHSTATFNGGTSYSVGGVRFVRGAPKPVTSRAVRQAIEGVDGFLIQDFHKEDPAPKPNRVVKDLPEDPEGETDPDDDSTPAPAPKKKTVKKKKKVKKVKGAKNA